MLHDVLPDCLKKEPSLTEYLAPEGKAFGWLL
jgi:hypothetical protein